MEYAEPIEQDAESDGEDNTAPTTTNPSSQNEETTSNEVEARQNASGPPAVPPRPEPRAASAPAGHKKFYKVIGSYRRGVLQFVADELAKRGYFPTQDSERATVFWSRCFYPHLPSLKQNQKVNFLPAMAEICRKDFLNRNIKRAVARFGPEQFSFWPISYNLPVEMAEFRADFEAQPGPFILKPPLAARGEGIKLVTSLEQVDEMPDYIKAKIPLAQRYVANPMLFFGHKMTFRIYAAVTSWDPLRIYVFPNGLVRICSEKYTTDADSYANSLVHLTNYDLQMEKEAAFNEEMPPEAIHDGLRSEIKHIFKELEEKHGIDSKRLWDDIHQLIAASFIAGAPIIQNWVAKKVPFRNNAFEVVGYDVLIDQAGKPWLLEINHTPSLSPHTELENGIKKAMLHELMDLVDIGNDGLANLIEATDKLWAKLQSILEPEPERYQPREAYAWLDGLPFDVTQLTRADIWAILDAELENRRRGSWQRVLPAATDRFDSILPPNSRDILVGKCIRNNIGIAELAAMIDDVQQYKQ